MQLTKGRRNLAMENKTLIRVDNEGRWYYGDQEIIREDVIAEFLKRLVIDEKGNYWIEWEGEKEPIEVEDTVFIVTWIEREGEIFRMRLNDGTEEILDLDTFYLSPKGIPYCRVKNKTFPARISRLAFYQLGQHALQTGQNFVIRLKGKDYILNK